jgi:predicted N-formylglutamate amidohydrolase
MMASTATNEVASDVFEIVNPSGGSDVVLVCEHASHTIPPEFAGLGLDAESRLSHIAWDPGAREVAVALSAHFDAPLVAQKVSRLVYDCNRPPNAQSAMPAKSAGQIIPGNINLSKGERAERTKRFYNRFRDALSSVIEARIAHGRAPVVITVHSFTPLYMGARREVEVGILHDGDTRLADTMLGAAAGSAFNVQRNSPYGPEDGVTHTLITQALSRGLANVMIEVRNDLVADEEGQKTIAGWLAGLIEAGLADLGQARGPRVAAGAAK